jgi:hypothetical protein
MSIEESTRELERTFMQRALEPIAYFNLWLAGWMKRDEPKYIRGYLDATAEEQKEARMTNHLSPEKDVWTRYFTLLDYTTENGSLDVVVRK